MGCTESKTRPQQPAAVRRRCCRGCLLAKGPGLDHYHGILRCCGISAADLDEDKTPVTVVVRDESTPLRPASILTPHLVPRDTADLSFDSVTSTASSAARSTPKSAANKVRFNQDVVIVTYLPSDATAPPPAAATTAEDVPPAAALGGAALALPGVSQAAAC